jgi:hypothetical protein
MREPETDEHLERAIDALKGLRISLKDASRQRIVARSREGGRRSIVAGLSLWVEMALSFRTPAAASAVALILVGFVAIIGVVRSTSTNKVSYGDSSVRLVSVVPASTGGVTLEWQNGQHRVYRVQKSTDPRNFTAAKTYAVRGTRWTDSSPSQGQVVYYRVQ